MLTELRIEDFAIIDQLELKFSDGLTTFTGETGAGKSIILDAIEVLMGVKADATFIRSGADKAILEAVFRIPQRSRAEMMEILEREDLLDDPEYIVFGRELRKEGRNTARINGHSVSVGLMRQLGGYLVDIHGQSEHLSLLNVRSHLGLLDRYAASQVLLDAYRESYKRLTDVRRELEKLRQSEKDAERRMDLLDYQIQEIRSANLGKVDEEELRQERSRLANAENLSSMAQRSLLLLDEGAEEAPAVTDALGQVVEALQSVVKMDQSQEELGVRAEALAVNAAELARDLRDYLEGIEFNPRRLNQLEDQIDLINRLKRKYGGTLEAVLAFAAKSEAELEMINHASERIEELEAEEGRLLPELAGKALALSASRCAAAETLAAGVEAQLADLSMNGARFKVSFMRQDDENGLPLEDGSRVAFDAHGMDRVEFLIAPNPGEGFKPLIKIASGGETSRLMLALKNVLAQADHVSTLIFDEIDQGIGGRVGAVVGEKLWQLARQHQVLCITHLPQLAAYGEEHYCVHKEIEIGRTTTRVSLLQGDARLNELALMLGQVSEVNRTAAREAVEQARQRREMLST
ncbi:MAG: DNA repair protein RecN [Anaerolineaceae bacterium]|jgi:DNA repair protein RecN (Recombination protein N)|nr:DNA repair protein RecN [Anaerolineaceae bacterium]